MQNDYRIFTMIFFVFLMSCNRQNEKEVVESDNNDPYVVVLGIAQDAGYPQAACRKSCCIEVWKDLSKRRHVSCIAIVDPSTSERWIVDATPDFRDQLRILDEIIPPSGIPGISGILLTHGHIGHYTGLMQLGHEVMGAKSVPVFAMPRMVNYLSTSGPWDQLVRYKNIVLTPIKDGISVKLNSRVTITPFLVPHRDEYTETVGYRIEGPNRAVVFIPDIDKWKRWERRIEDVISNVDIAYLDGAFYAEGEIPGRNMSEIPHPFISESIDRFTLLPDSEKAKIRFIHLNHTNPALKPDSQARQRVEEAGFRIAEEKEKIGL